MTLAETSSAFRKAGYEVVEKDGAVFVDVETETLDRDLTHNLIGWGTLEVRIYAPVRTIVGERIFYTCMIRVREDLAVGEKC